jgi:hypothetical protein
MPDYKNNNSTSRFKKPFTSGGANRGPDRFARPGSGGPREMHTAECSNCRKSCQVPFRPNGTKPVFCADCFTREGDRDSRDARGSFQKREYGAPRSAPTEDRRIDELKRQLIQMDSKLDRIVQMIDAANRAPAHAVTAAPAKAKVSAAPAEAPAKEKKAAAKKAKPAKKA